MAIIIHHFKVMDKVEQKKKPTNLFRDDDAKMHMLSFLNS